MMPMPWDDFQIGPSYTHRAIEKAREYDLISTINYSRNAALHS